MVNNVRYILTVLIIDCWLMMNEQHKSWNFPYGICIAFWGSIARDEWIKAPCCNVTDNDNLESSWLCQIPAQPASMLRVINCSNFKSHATGMLTPQTNMNYQDNKIPLNKSVGRQTVRNTTRVIALCLTTAEGYMMIIYRKSTGEMMNIESVFVDCMI